MDTYQAAPQTAPQTYNYEDYDRIWQRVLPELNTFPESRNEDGDLPGTPIPGDDDLMGPAEPAGPAASPVPAPAAPEPARPEAAAQMPGAQQNPCCMGTAAQQSIGVIIGFIEIEVANCRFYRCFYPKAPNQAAARAIRQMMLDEMDHVRRLRAIYYLITGECFHSTRQIPMPEIGPYCDTLRAAYHEATCGSFNYFRAAAGAPDPCLRALFERLGNSRARHAETFVNLLGAMMC